MLISIHITPKSAKNQVIGWKIDAEGRPVLRIKIAAPPEEGKANNELIRFLSKEWNITRSSLELISGETSRYKRLKIHDSALALRLISSQT